MKVLLFDIDGTLLLTNGAGRSVIETALSSVMNCPIRTDNVSFSGKTDPQIMMEVLEANEQPVDHDGEQLQRCLQSYQDLMHDTIHEYEVNLLRGVPSLLDQLSTRTNIQLGLLTGNLETMAYLKLEQVNLSHHFSFGAFGSDHPDRYALPTIALQRARDAISPKLEGEDLVIIGDTEHDILCGKSIGARSVGVCTGYYSREQLEIHNPDLLLDTFEDLLHDIEQLFC